MLGDHQTAKAILEEVGTLVRGCADAGIASTLLASAEPSAARRGDFAQRGVRGR